MNVTAQAGDTLISAAGRAPSRPAEQKNALRKNLRLLRKQLTATQGRAAAQQVARRCFCYAPLRRARRVAVYLSMGSELPTSALITTLHARGIAVFAPAIVGGQLRFRALCARGLQRHSLGMQQPRYGRAYRASAMDVIVLPLLGFDAQGMRLGQGGGYYDRALQRSRFRPLRLGLAYAAQGVDALPQEPWDQPLHAVLTEQGMTVFPRKLFR